MSQATPRVLDPIVIEHRVHADSAELELVVPRDLYYLKGHFPGAPIVPGVVHIEWAIALARRYLKLRGAFAGMENVKFQRAITPATRVTLALKYAAAASELHFDFSSVEGRYSSGRVVLSMQHER